MSDMETQNGLVVPAKVTIARLEAENERLRQERDELDSRNAGLEHLLNRRTAQRDRALRALKEVLINGTITDGGSKVRDALNADNWNLAEDECARQDTQREAAYTLLREIRLYLKRYGTEDDEAAMVDRIDALLSPTPTQKNENDV